MKTGAFGPRPRRRTRTPAALGVSGDTVGCCAARTVDRSGVAKACANSGALGCVDLRARFGDLYKIGLEEQAMLWPRRERVWLMQLRCKYGVVSPVGGEWLQAVADRPRVGARIRRLPFVVGARGYAEVAICFHVDHLGEVLRILQPFRRRRVGAAERERLRRIGTAALARYRRKSKRPERVSGARMRRAALGDVETTRGER